MHNWKLSSNCDGFIFFHTRDFYDAGFTSERVQDYPFYSSHHTTPLLSLKSKPYHKLKELLKEITEEYNTESYLKFQKLHALVNLVYIEVSRLHTSIVESGKENYQEKLKKFEELIDLHFKENKAAGHYAGLMHISEKHLNRISNLCLKKTSTDLISERVILEAKRMLIYSHLNVTQIAYDLGYTDKSYFNRFLKNERTKHHLVSQKNTNTKTQMSNLFPKMGIQKNMGMGIYY